MYNALFASFCILRFFIAAKTVAHPPSHSPEAHTDLICHTAQASECYPAIFQPTELFQLVHDDQSIPPGLHVRLNLATGLKEARLNVPESDDAPKADLVIVDSAPARAVEEQAPILEEGSSQEEVSSLPENGHHLEETHRYTNNGEVEEFDDYQLKVEMLLSASSPKDILSPIDALTDFAHSLEWGLTISRDFELVKLLINFINPSHSAQVEVQSAAALLLGTAIQNNPEAREALLSSLESFRVSENSPMNVVHTALKTSLTNEIASEHVMTLQKRLLFLLYQLCQDPTQLQSFISSSGLTTLQTMFGNEHINSSDGRDKIRLRIANFMSDHIFADLRDPSSHSRPKNLSPDLSIETSDMPPGWREAVETMGSWCQSFHAAIDEHEGVLSELSSEGKEAYSSISEAYAALEGVLDGYEHVGGCKCHIMNNCPSYRP